MSDDLLITPGSRKLEIKDSSGNVDAKIETDASGNLNITNAGGDIAIGDTTSDIFVGDGTNNIDIVFEQSGEIRGTSGVTITLGASGSSVAMATDLSLGTNDITNVGTITAANLNITGTTTTVNSTNTTITDNIIELNSGLTGANSKDIGFIFERGSTGNNAGFVWDESADRFTVFTTTDTASSSTVNTGTVANFQAGSFYGNGANLSSLNGSNISSGTVAAARIANLATSKITSGTFADARISSSSVTQHLGSYLTTSSGLNASNLTSGTISTNRINQPTSGDWFSGGIPIVATDGVMEIGRYIDFHNTDTTTADFDVRLDANTANSLNVTGVSTTDGLRVEGNKVFHAGNDGAGSGLNADVLQGNGPSYYRNASNLNSGTVATTRLPNAAITYQQSTDDRDMKPSTSGISTGIQAIKPFFSSFGGMTGSANSTYLDVLAFDTYSDSSGGGPSAITFHKGSSAGDPKMYIWHTTWNNTTWSTGQRVFADNYHPNADEWTTALEPL